MDESAYAAWMGTALDSYAVTQERARQTRLGISDIGTCREKARRLLAGERATDAPSLRAAEMGTAVHQYVAMALASSYPGLLIERKITVSLPNNTIIIPGTADIIDPHEPSVTDLKTRQNAAALAYTASHGADDQQRYQRHLCYLGALQEGLVPMEGITRNVWLPRAGDTDDVIVEQEPFSWDVIKEVDEWLEHVAYAAAHHELAPRDKHAAWCAKFCQFYSDCRLGSDSARVDDPALIDAAQSWDHHDRAAKHHRAIADGAKQELEVLQGHDPRYVVEIPGGTVGWVYVHRESNPYYKIEKRKS